MDSPDVLLITPPFDFTAINSVSERTSRQAGYYLYYPPMGLCSIGAVLEEAGYKVDIIDGQVDAGSEEGLLELAAGARPRLVGVGVTTPALPVAGRIVREIKKRLGVPVVVGGPHVSCDPVIVRSMGADYGVIGDGEMPMLKIADALLRGGTLPPDTDGIMSADTVGKPKPSLADLDILPFPARRLLRNPDSYFNPFVRARTTLLLTARGCPYHCSFCCRTPSMGAYRPLPVERVLDEMMQVQKEGVGFVSVIDETFTFDRDRCLRIVREMIGRGIKFKWSCQTRAELVDEELMKKLRAAGCINISFGIEAGDPEVRNQLEKQIPDEAFEKAFSACRAAGVSINAFVIIGSPDEMPEQVERSISRVIELAPDYAVYNVGTLFPGTKEYDRRLEAGKITREVWDRYLEGGEQLPVLSRVMMREELALLLRRGYSMFYMRPGYVLKKISKIRSFRDIAVLARQAKTVFSDYVVSKA